MHGTTMKINKFLFVILILPDYIAYEDETDRVFRKVGT